MASIGRLAVVGVLVMVAACGPAGGPAAPTSPEPTTSAAASASAPAGLAAIRARGTVVVSIRVEAPGGGRAPQDPAHGQKRAFETAVVTLVAQRIFGPSVKVDLRAQGGDRLGPVERGEADIAMVVAAGGSSDRALLSDPYAAAGIVLAVPAASTASGLGDLAGKTIAVAMDELAAPQVAQDALRARGVQATLQTVMGVLGAADAVASGSAAGLIGDRIGIEVLLKQRPGTLRILDEIAPRGYVLAAHRTADELTRAVNGAVAELTASGEIERAATQAGFPYRRPEVPR